MDVTSSEEGRFPGIRQSIGNENNVPFILYTYVEPVVTLQTQAGYPAVNFTRFTSSITLSDGTILPTKTYPINKGTIDPNTLAGGSTAIIPNLEVQLPIISADRDLQNVVYPGNNAPRVRDGRASVVLFGTDLNGHSIELPLSVPLSFESVVFPDTTTPPTAAPSASPSANSSSNSSPNPGGQ